PAYLPGRLPTIRPAQRWVRVGGVETYPTLRWTHGQMRYAGVSGRGRADAAGWGCGCGEGGGRVDSRSQRACARAVPSLLKTSAHGSSTQGTIGGRARALRVTTAVVPSGVPVGVATRKSSNSPATCAGAAARYSRTACSTDASERG